MPINNDDKKEFPSLFGFGDGYTSIQTIRIQHKVRELRKQVKREELIDLLKQGVKNV